MEWHHIAGLLDWRQTIFRPLLAELETLGQHVTTGICLFDRAGSGIIGRLCFIGVS
jgi:hypothetical protein